jgi:hypothetical protein
MKLHLIDNLEKKFGGEVNKIQSYHSRNASIQNCETYELIGSY